MSSKEYKLQNMLEDLRIRLFVVQKCLTKLHGQYTSEIEGKMKDETLYCWNRNDCVNVTDISLFHMGDHRINKQSILIIIE